MSAATLTLLVIVAAFAAIGLVVLAAILPYLQHAADLASALPR